MKTITVYMYLNPFFGFYRGPQFLELLLHPKPCFFGVTFEILNFSSGIVFYLESPVSSLDFGGEFHQTIELLKV